jgi:hypothetical protein
MYSKPKQTVIVVAALAFLAPTAFAQHRDAALVKRGAWLVGLGGCVDCHTPFRMGAGGPEKDLSKGLSGHPEHLELPAPPVLGKDWNWAGSATMTAFVGPWGTTYASNLTPDRETGIGAWKETDFMRTMRTGKHFGVGRAILPLHSVASPCRVVGQGPAGDLCLPDGAAGDA